MRKFIGTILMSVVPSLLFIAVVFSSAAIQSVAGKSDVLSNIGTVIFELIAFAYGIYIAYLVIYIYVELLSGEYTTKQTAILNLIIKLVFFIVYCCIGMLALFGALASIWAIGVWAICLIAFLAAYAVSIIHSIIFVVRLSKSKITKKRLSVFLAISSFIAGMDIIAAIIYLVFAVKNEKKGIGRKALSSAEKKERLKQDGRHFLFMWRMILISLLPYSFSYFADQTSHRQETSDIISAVIYYLYILYVSARIIILTFKGKNDLRDASMLNFVTKLVQAPIVTVYSLASVLIICDILMGGKIRYDVFAGIPTLIITGLICVGTVRRMKQDGIISKGALALMILSFVPFADVVVSLIVLVKSVRAAKATTSCGTELYTGYVTEAVPCYENMPLLAEVTSAEETVTENEAAEEKDIPDNEHQ